MGEQQFELDAECFGPVESINAQHHEIVDVLNKGAEHAQDGRIPDFADIFSALIDSMARHFRDEEAIMEKTEYPGREWHAEHHAKSLKRALDTVERCKARGYADEFDLQRLYDSVVLDVTRADAKFFEYLEQTGQVHLVE